jgi:hypothetical protein
MIDSVPDDDAGFQVRLETDRPVELFDLGAFFSALGKHYEEYVNRGAFDHQDGNARLYIADLRKGSILVLLKNLLEQGSLVLKDIDVLAGFMTNLHELIEYFRTQKPKAPDSITRDEAARLSRILEPVAKDGGSSISFTFVGNTAPITVTNITVSSETANAIQNNVRRFLGPPLPAPGSFEREVLYLEQMRKDARSHVGDRGVIERFSSKPVKLHFMTPESKAAILDKPQNPFKMAYIVDGQVSTIRGEPALYKVTNVHETLSPRSPSVRARASKRLLKLPKKAKRK